jgi:hypothetical protein
MTLGSVSDYLLLIVTIIGLRFAYKQLKSLADSVKSSEKNNAIQTIQLMVSFSKLITESKIILDTQSIKLRDIKNRFDAGEEFTKAEIQREEFVLSIRTQDYLNSVDNICSCLLKDEKLETDYKKDYYKVINEAFTNYTSEFNISQDNYHNLWSLYVKWNQNQGNA